MKNSGDWALVVLIVLCGVLFGGSPDLTDAIVNYVMSANACAK